MSDERESGPFCPVCFTELPHDSWEETVECAVTAERARLRAAVERMNASMFPSLGGYRLLVSRTDVLALLTPTPCACRNEIGPCQRCQEGAV